MIDLIKIEDEIQLAYVVEIFVQHLEIKINKRSKKSRPQRNYELLPGSTDCCPKCQRKCRNRGLRNAGKRF